jgi:glutathione S-transferase
MQLIGMMDSPFVRRVAISMRMMGLEFEHRPLSIFNSYDEFRTVNPLVKVPTLVCDDGAMLVDSSLILDYLETRVQPGQRLMPGGIEQRREALRIIGVALIAMEKTAQLIYETRQRPAELQHPPWIERLQQQLLGAFDLLELTAPDGKHRLAEQRLAQDALSTAVAWRFSRFVFPERVKEQDYPRLRAFSAEAERLRDFLACPLD